MIVKIWPVRGTEGVKNTLLYVQDDRKVVQIETNEDGTVTRRTIIDTQESARLDAQQYFIEHEPNISRVLEYVADEQKIRSKFISGYLCDPQKADDDFHCSRHITCKKAGKKVKDGAKDIVAFHIVQSFPEDLEISDEEVHQCGLELVERLGNYQAVVCSHVHPVIDEDGEVHGKCKHNHIVINAFIHPQKMDPQHPGRVKYVSSPKDYQLLRFWNDEIAMEHGLPIIRDPDLHRKYSWYEAEKDKQNASWKGRVRLDIQEARSLTNSWDEFKSFMEEHGYRVLERGSTVSYITPHQQRVRGNTLGKPYSKEGLEDYWAFCNQIQQEVQKELKLNRDLRLMELVRARQGLQVAVPLGNEGLENVQYHLLSLERTDLADLKVLNTYFREKEHYDIYDQDENILAAASGTELIQYFMMTPEERQAYQIEEPEGRDPEQWKQNNEYYYQETFRNSQTKEHYRVSKKDETGRLRSLLELIFLLARIVLEHEDGRWPAKNVHPTNKNEIYYGPTNKKIQAMMDALAIAREEECNTPGQVDDRLHMAGADLSRIRAALKKQKISKEKMEPIAEAIQQYRDVKESAEEIFNMPLGTERTRAEAEHDADLKIYRAAKAKMHRNGITTEEEILGFEARFDGVQKAIDDLEEKLGEASAKYTRLKKLKNCTEYAQKAKFVYGPSYDPERTAAAASGGGGQGRSSLEGRVIDNGAI